MVNWKSGPGMVDDDDDDEEEGEYNCKDNGTDFTDPYAELSYIGDKVQSLLGHFQKYFEGGVVSTENFGAIFGGYGSFLPVHQRSPHSKSPARVQTPKLPVLSSQVYKESCSPNASFPVHMGPPASSPRPSMGLSQSPKASAVDVLVKQKSCANFDQVENPEKVVLTVEKLNNPLKIRLKLPQNLSKHHELGLTTSTSGDSSSEESSGLPIESHDDSPANIIQTMTSFLEDGSMLLSPLCDEWLNLLEEVKYSVNSGNEAAPESSSVDTRIVTTNVPLDKEMEKSCKGEGFVISENEREAECLFSYHDLDDKNLSGRFMEPDKVLQVRKKRESNDRVKLRADSSYSVKAALFENASDKNNAMYEQPIFRCNTTERIIRNRSKTPGSDILACPGSLKVDSALSEGTRVKRDSSKLSVESGLQYNSGEEGESTLARAVNNFSSEEKLKGSQSCGNLAPMCKVILRDSGSNGSKSKCSGKKVHLVKDNLANGSSDYKDNLNLVMGKVSGVLRKKSNPETPKTNSMHAGNLKDASTEQHYSGRLTSLADTSEPPIAAVLSNEGNTTDIISEAWIECDICNKWRKLPYGKNADALSAKWWTCSMLDWLPGMNMNHCGVSERETELAVHPTYPQHTVSTYNLQTHADNNTNLGVTSASFDRSHVNFDSDHIAAELVKKQTLKQKLIRDSMSNAVPSYGKTNLNQQSLQMGRAKALNQSVRGQIAKNKLDLKHTTNSATIVLNLKKRKDEHMITDDTTPKKRMRKESFQDADKMMMKKIKISGEPNLDNFQKSRLSNKSSIKDVKEPSTEHMSVFAGKGKTQTRLKQPPHKMQDLPDSGALVQKSSKGRAVVNLKRKFSTREDSQPLHTQLKHGKVSIQEKIDGDFHRGKKSRLYHVEGKEKESKICEVQAVLNAKSTDSGTETDQRARKVGPKETLIIEDVVKPKDGLGYEAPSTAPTSSSSKISDSRKYKVKYLEVKSSPAESVSSSPARFPYPNHELPMMMKSEAKMNSKLNHASARGSVRKSWDVNECSRMKVAMKEETTVLDFRETDGREKSCELASRANYGQYKDDSNRDTSSDAFSYKNSTKNLVGSSTVQISSQMGDKCGDLCLKKPLPGSIGAKKRSFVEPRPSETSVAEDSLQSRKDQNVTGNLIRQNEEDRFMAANKNISNLIACSSLKKAKDVLREAEEHRCHADLTKSAGLVSESNSECFKAAIKFLHGASLLEASTGENGKNIELSPMELYGTVATLCKTCACDYQKDQELAAAALAHKCVEVACMRVVHIKSSATHKVLLDLQSSLHMVPQGESPSSSASDVDNLNNSSMADKTTLFKGNVLHPANHDILPRNRPSILQLLDFTKDAITAMEATKKSQELLTAACVKLEDSQNKEVVDRLKRVIGFSFQDVEEFVRLISLVVSTINCKSLS